MGWRDLFKKDKNELKVDTTLIRRDAVSAVLDSMFSTFQYTLQMNTSTIDEMMLDNDIKSAIDVTISTITAKELKVISRQNQNTEEIEARFNNINFNEVIKNILISKWKQRTVQEIMWNKDTFTIDDILVKPNRKYSRDAYGWFYSYKGKNEYLTPEKYLVSVNEESKEFPFGKSDLESLLKVYEIKKITLEKMGNIVNKYGEIIKWYTYDRNEAVGTDGKINLTNLKAKAEKMRAMTDNDVIAVPVHINNQQGGFNKDFGFITLDQFKTEVHIALQKWCQEQIGKAFFGGSLTQDYGTNGSYSLAQGHQEIRKEKAQSICNYIQNVLQQLLWIDGQLYGYDDSQFYFKLQDEPNLSEIEDLKIKKANKIKLLKDAGYILKNETVAKEMGYEVTDIEGVANANNTV